VLGWIRSTLGLDAKAATISRPGDGPSAVQFSEYRVRATFRRRTSTHIDNWFPAAHPDEAVAAARRRFPTADAWDYLGERRELTAAEIEALRRSGAAR
jgi:hypothetical protein